jgi:hypothetical protein
MTEPAAKAEKVFLDRDGVRVTNARFQVAGQTYAMSAVNTVAYQVEAAQTGGPIGLCVLGGLVLLVALLTMRSGVGPVNGFFSFVGVLMIVGGVIALRGAKPTYLVKLSTASGEVKALSSHDKGFVEAVVRALNDSVVSRG